MKPLRLTMVLCAIMLFSNCVKNDCDCKGPAKNNCICQEIYDPVCGCDGKTYSNACEAECMGVKKYTKGACKGE